jgi:hypothetical protein
MTKATDDLAWAVEGPPIGIWATAGGTADMLMHDRLSLRPDGTGHLRSTSVMRGEETYPVMWWHEGPGVLKITMLLPGDDPNAPPEWETVRYAAALASNDLTTAAPVLKNTDDDVFWTLTGPVALASRTAD